MSSPVTQTPPIGGSFLDSRELWRRQAKIKEQATTYYEKIHIPTDEQVKKLEEILKEDGECDHDSENYKTQRRFAHEVNVHVFVNPVISGGFAAAADRMLFVHPLFMLSPKDFPKELQLTGPKDPLLCDKMHLEKMKKWIVEKFEKYPEVNEKNLGNLREFQSILYTHLKIWQNSEDLDQMRNFVIAHEVGHIFNKHDFFPSPWQRRFTIAAGVCSAIGGALTSAIPVAIAATSIATEATYVGGKCLQILRSRKMEKEADLTALRLTGTTKGAEVFFNTLHEAGRNLKKRLSWPRFLANTILNPVAFFDLGHPALLDRVAYLKAAQSEFESSECTFSELEEQLFFGNS